MRIGILTTPLGNNYGGLLQAFALQKALKQIGHEVWTVDIHKVEPPIQIRLLSIVKRTILYFFYSKNIIVRTWPTIKEYKFISQHTNSFIKEYITTTELITYPYNFKKLNKYKFHAYIVGSDQVWRPSHTPSISKYFFDFLKKENSIRRIAYAASFGVDDWEYTPKQTRKFAPLAKKFNAIAVRENSGIRLCKENLGVDAVHVIDPTMLLTKEDYINLVQLERVSQKECTLLTYILDKSDDKRKITQKIAEELSLTAFSIQPSNQFMEVGSKSITDCVFPPVTEWIRGFIDAEFVVTDSFHGTVFSIIFNKPFLTIGNANRGLARFISLLNMFDLADRLIFSFSDLNTELINKSIDYTKVNQILKEERQKALSFLTTYLR